MRARPLRFDKTRLLFPVVLAPGLALAAIHAPLALLSFGPLVLTSFVLSRRERYRLDHCTVRVEGPALELRYGAQVLGAVDLRYVARDETRSGDLVLSEEAATYLAFGAEPPDSAYPLGPDGDPVPVAFFRAVRLAPADLLRLRQAVEAVPRRPPPDLGRAAALLEVLGSVGLWGRRAERCLVRHLLDSAPRGNDRPGGIEGALRDLSLRQDAAGRAARRVLEEAGRA